MSFIIQICILRLILPILLFSSTVHARNINRAEIDGVIIEYTIPRVLQPMLSEDGKRLTNAVRPVVFLARPFPSEQPMRIPPPQNVLDREGQIAMQTVGTQFSITYVLSGEQDAFGEPCGDFPEAARNVFNAAAAIWGGIIRSSAPIRIRACWANMTGAALGYSAAGVYHRNLAGFLPNTWYQGALANALQGFVIEPDPRVFDMHITYNSNQDWYFGTDGNIPANQVDLLSVMLHEIAHGLGFSGTMSYVEGIANWGFYGSPSIYDHFMASWSDLCARWSLLIDTDCFPNDSFDLGLAVTSDNLWWGGPNASKANGDQPVKMFAPSQWNSGSSYDHLDMNTFDGSLNRLMVYAIYPGDSIHDPGLVTRGLLQDIGWEVAALSDEDCFFFWAESNYPQYFRRGSATKTFEQFHYRFYSDTDSYLGNNLFDSNIWAIIPALGIGLTNLGSNRIWFERARADSCQ